MCQMLCVVLVLLVRAALKEGLLAGLIVATLQLYKKLLATVGQDPVCANFPGAWKGARGEEGIASSWGRGRGAASLPRSFGKAVGCQHCKSFIGQVTISARTGAKVQADCPKHSLCLL